MRHSKKSRQSHVGDVSKMANSASTCLGFSLHLLVFIPELPFPRKGHSQIIDS